MNHIQQRPCLRVTQWARDHWWELVAYAGLLLVASVMRLVDLGSRAMHHDESLHAYYSWLLATGEGYTHNPMMHGPFQMEATAAIFRLFGDSDITARLLYAFAGIALVLLPFLFRARLGRLGALFVSAMLAVSPAILYFSRFARNDILMAVWTLGLVICMWRYIDDGKHRYLYIAAALLAVAFATKETAYLVTATLGLFLALWVIGRNWAAIRLGVTFDETSPPAAVQRLIGGAWRTLTLTGMSRPAVFLVLLITLTLPLWAALVSVFQDIPPLSWLNLVLASPVGGQVPTGAPTRGGVVIAFLVVAGLLWLSAEIGLRWSRSVWLRAAVIFWAIWLLLYSTFFTNLAGIDSGVWQSLGYWLVQQGEARGAQPWYYYFIITPLYEFLPLLFAVIGGVYYMRRNDIFGRFLVYWAITTFFLYTIASEKMPWLLVNVTLPLIVLAGKFLGDAIKGIQWRHLVYGWGLLLLVGVPVFLVLAWGLAIISVDIGQLADALVLMASLVILAGLAGLGYFVAQRVGYRNSAAFSMVPIVAILLVLSVRAGWYASYRNGDVPVEMMVYTQTSPDIVGLLRQVERVGEAAGDRKGVPITIDETSGFTWPWAWYLREYTSVEYSGTPLQSPPDADVLLIHSSNQPESASVLGDRFSEGIRIRHRWWFPETYKGLTVGEFLGALVDRNAWRRAMDYFLQRKISTPLGSEDAYLYFSREFPLIFKPSL